jgi:hypothetical protein
LPKERQVHIFITMLLAAVSTVAENIRNNIDHYGTPRDYLEVTFRPSNDMLGEQPWWAINEIEVDPEPEGMDEDNGPSYEDYYPKHSLSSLTLDITDDYPDGF